MEDGRIVYIDKQEDNEDVHIWGIEATSIDVNYAGVWMVSQSFLSYRTGTFGGRYYFFFTLYDTLWMIIFQLFFKYVYECVCCHL